MNPTAAQSLMLLTGALALFLVFSALRSVMRRS